MKIYTTTLKQRAGCSLLVILTSLGMTGVFAAGSPLPQPTAWVDCEKFNSAVTNTSFKTNGDAFDELYAGGNGFLGGTPLISDAAPGDTNYNGGRWHLNVLKATVDPDKYSSNCSAQALDPNDFVSTTVYFECPLFPTVGHN